MKNSNSNITDKKAGKGNGNSVINNHEYSKVRAVASEFFFKVSRYSFF